VGGGTDSPVDLPKEVFEGQMEELVQGFRPVSLQAGLEEIASGGNRPGVPVVVTFDDAFRNFVTQAWPVLRRLGIPATLYVPVGFIDGRAPAPLRGAEDLPAATWDELRELARQGVEIGSHSYSHPDFRTLTGAQARDELVRSQDRLREELTVEAASFAYPRALWSPTADAEVRRLHHNAVVAGGRRILPGESQLHRLSRLPLRRDQPTHLAPLLSASVWLEERVADWWRQRRPPSPDTAL
jgi:peptidoglycan/xylan/chitin deacetylase (PgdA/CDA1 family)